MSRILSALPSSNSAHGHGVRIGSRCSTPRAVCAQTLDAAPTQARPGSPSRVGDADTIDRERVPESETGMATAPQPDDATDEGYSLPPIVELSEDEGRALFERQARKYMGMSGDEFLRKWDAGEIEDPDRSEVLTVVFLIPLVRDFILPS